MNQYHNKELFALEMANSLNDPEAYSLFLAFARQYPEEQLRRLLAKALEMPAHLIRKNRAALFVSLVKNYAKTQSVYNRF